MAENAGASGVELDQATLRAIEDAVAVKARLFTDGGARGNPGPAAYGFVLEAEDGTVLAAEGRGDRRRDEQRRRVQRARRRPATKALELHVPEVEVVSDSELLVKQMRGEYRVKNETLRRSSSRRRTLARGLQSVEYRHVKRAHNELADRLVNEALDADMNHPFANARPRRRP